ncbi:nitrogenase [Thiospirochaeta perfilievii]|uniref:Nitrogenase n=1 Tax=Thiospirochaeta perfilievii TaxID=252967 RepID=A0A5C1QAQ0_9SPIO|nr:nitrogenase component 1 [Thiospirochaeta perfilievii]QEN04591.1 nitrogenase [Thiospirochaeta perfilievii]
MIEDDYVSTTNPCKVCSPLGVSLAVKGIEGAMSIMHGSQGCATYIRRYMISHFKEPLDIASSSFSETSAIFGGKSNLKSAILNVKQKYDPKLIAVSATCLSETIGDDVAAYCRECNKEVDGEILAITPPPFGGAHLSGYYAAVTSLVKEKKREKEKIQSLNIFPSIYSTADLRYLKQLVASYFDNFMVMPDYSETLDGGIWGEYLPIAPGGTPLKKIGASYLADFSIGFSPFLEDGINPGKTLESENGVEYFPLRPPIGVRGCDDLTQLLCKKSGNRTNQYYLKERARLIDAYADSHKYTFGKRAVVYGDADFVAGIASFLDEVGITPVICACGTPFKEFEKYIKSCLEFTAPEVIKADVDFKTLDDLLEGVEIDLIIGNSKGYKIARDRDIPFVRCGFPIHDRIGGPRFLHIGYKGAMNLLDHVTNTLLTAKQDASPVGYAYQ